MARGVQGYPLRSRTKAPPADPSACVGGPRLALLPYKVMVLEHLRSTCRRGFDAGEV